MLSNGSVAIQRSRPLLSFHTWAIQRLKAPHKAFHRRIGPLAAANIDPDGNVVSAADWAANLGRWLPSDSDRAFVASLMGRVVEPGRFANWIAPPARGVHSQPVEFEYVRFN